MIIVKYFCLYLNISNYYLEEPPFCGTIFDDRTKLERGSREIEPVLPMRRWRNSGLQDLEEKFGGLMNENNCRLSQIKIFVTAKVHDVAA